LSSSLANKFAMFTVILTMGFGCNRKSSSSSSAVSSESYSISVTQSDKSLRVDTSSIKESGALQLLICKDEHCGDVVYKGQVSVIEGRAEISKQGLPVGDYFVKVVDTKDNGDKVHSKSHRIKITAPSSSPSASPA